MPPTTTEMGTEPGEGRGERRRRHAIGVSPRRHSSTRARARYRTRPPKLQIIRIYRSRVWCYAVYCFGSAESVNVSTMRSWLRLSLPPYSNSCRDENARAAVNGQKSALRVRIRRRR